VNLAGVTDIGDVASVLRRTKLFISNDSGPVHIACAVGTPVIAVVGLGAVDMIEDGVNGFLVNREGAAEAMAETVLRLAGDPQLRDRMSRQARSSARRYHITEAADRLLEAYSQALEEHARRHGASEDRASRPTRGE